MTRYARQIILPEIGEEGQKKLSCASVLIIGAGGLGSVAAIYLAGAGIGRLTIADADEVRLHNLNRQILYNEGDLGKMKFFCADTNLRKFNSEIEINTTGRIDDVGIAALLADKKFSVVVDGTDNFETRYLVNEACVEYKIPFIHGSVLKWSGQVSTFDSSRGPCYRCLYPEEPPEEESPTCFRAGVIGVVPGLIGILQAAEVIKIVLQNGSLLVGRLLLADLLKNEFRTVEIKKDSACPVCGQGLL